LDRGILQVSTDTPLVSPGGVVRGEFEAASTRTSFVGKEIERARGSDGTFVAHHFRRFTDHLTAYREVLRDGTPTAGCIKLRHSMMRQRAAYRIHTAPTVLDPKTGKRRAISYAEAIERFADLLLAHRGKGARTLIYASGQCDYFAVFAVQEVFRLLGIRNLTGNAEHCLNAGAVHNEMLTGQEGPFLTIAHVLGGSQRVYVFNGWNGFIAHPPVFKAILAKPDLDAYLVEVMVTESAKALAEKLGKDRILLIRPRSDPHLALAVAHEVITRHPGAVHQAFIDRFGDRASFEAYAALAGSEQFAPERVAARIAPEAEYTPRLLAGIRQIAFKIAQTNVVPINIPSVGLSQTSGAVAHCLWGSLLGMVGKYGLNADGTVAGGTLRLPGQINAESEVQGMSRKYFMGRLPIAQAEDAARRMGLPPDAYEGVLRDTARAALDYSDPTPDERELFVCMGTQFEANMMGRKRWIDKLTTPSNTLVVIDPIPDPFTEQHAALILPSPPHPAAPKLYQNGEWKFTLSVPQKRAAPETRSDATILYDAMAAITQRLARDGAVAAAHPDLARHVASGYLPRRFCAREDGGELTRIDGEVSRAELWERVLAYLGGGSGPLYCLPEYGDGRPIPWTELLERGSVYYGGIGTTRYKLDYADPMRPRFATSSESPGDFAFSPRPRWISRFRPELSSTAGAPRSPTNAKKSPLRSARSTPEKRLRSWACPTRIRSSFRRRSRKKTASPPDSG
jgi:anaerobic selenocysteine-containing dehydrogenase